MMKYRLKKGQERFQEVDGPFAGRDYRPGAEYAEADIPADKLKKFDTVKAPAEKATLKPVGNAGSDAKKKNVREAPVKMSEGQS